MDKSSFNINLTMLPVHPWANALSLLSSILPLLWSQELFLTWTVAAVWEGAKGTGQGQRLPLQHRKAHRSEQWAIRQESSGRALCRLLKCWTFSHSAKQGCSAVSCLRQMLIFGYINPVCNCLYWFELHSMAYSNTLSSPRAVWALFLGCVGGLKGEKLKRRALVSPEKEWHWSAEVS